MHTYSTTGKPKLEPNFLLCLMEQCTEDDLREVFTKFGTVIEARIALKPGMLIKHHLVCSLFFSLLWLFCLQMGRCAALLLLCLKMSHKQPKHFLL